MKPKKLGWKLLLAVAFLHFLSPNLFSQDIISLQKVKNYVSENKQRLGLSTNDVSTLSLTHEYTDASTGIHHMYATQKINGITITNSTFSLHSDGNKSYDASRLIAANSFNIKSLSTSISSSAAISKLMEAVNYEGSKTFQLKQQAQGQDQLTVYKRGDSYIWDIPCRLVYYNNARLKTLQPAWEVQLMDLNEKHYWLGYIDASSGKVLEKRDLILHCSFGGAATDAHPLDHKSHQHEFVEEKTNLLSTNKEEKLFAVPGNQYRVYDLPLESPIDSLQQPAPHALSLRSGDTLSSPDGWHRVGAGAIYNFTRGNNVHAFYDPSPGPLGGVPNTATVAYATNYPPVSAPVPEPYVFDYPINLAAEPAVYQKAAIVNLFYWNNLMHDVFYYMGFTEAAGNFQESHLYSPPVGLRGGAAGQGDAVLAQAQDGGGTNNANFLTLTDGTPGGAQMQMYLWTASFPDSLVQITSSTTGVPPAGLKYFAVQGSFAGNPTTNTNLYTNPVLNKQFVLVQKNPLSTVGSPTEGCSTGQQSLALPPGNDVNGKIVLIDRGTCAFVEKVFGAQQGGAAGVIVINNSSGAPISMGGADAPGVLITIPAVMISQENGKALKAQIAAGATIIGSLKATKPPAPKRDGDIDNGVIAHEYGHGISNRLTGGPMTTLPLGGDEQGGEGWSDFVALYMTLRSNDLSAPATGHPYGLLPTRSIGNYVTYQPYNGRGIREYPYSTDLNSNPSTFSYIKRPDYSGTHSVGFVWCTMLYEMMQSFVDLYGMNDNVYEGANPTADRIPPSAAKGNNIASRLVIEGMKLQPTSPTFVQQRDAILRADTLLYSGKFSCMIWKAFAKRGLGFSAVSGTNALGDEIEAFDVPYACDPTQRRVRIEKSGPIKAANGSQVDYTIKVKNILPTAVTGLIVTDTLPAGLNLVSASNAAVHTGNLVKWTLDINGGDSVLLNLKVVLNSATASIQTFGDDHESAAANWVTANMGGIGTWSRQSNAAQAFSGTNYWFAPDTDLGGSNTALTTTNPINVPANAELVFIHKFATESGYDGGVVEISTDNTNFTYLPASKFVKGGYTGVIPTADNPNIGLTDLSAFTGASGGYRVSIAKLDDYANKNIYIRFRSVSDAAGGSVQGGGWWLDDVYVLLNRTEITNKATAITTPGVAALQREGTNAEFSTTSFILGGGALPNNMGVLSAMVSRQSTVNLSWNTYNETNTEAFEVERKRTGEGSFTKIGTVLPATTNAQSKSYGFTDPNITNGSQYQYRIRQVNKSGEGYYTNIAVVNLSGKSFMADIYPNPAKNIANLSIVNPAGGKVTINLFDVAGKKLATFIGAEASSQVIPLPVTGLKAGAYWIEVNTIENHTTLKLVIEK